MTSDQAVCSAHGVAGCEWCHPDQAGFTAAETGPSGSAVIAASAIKSAGFNGLASIWVDHGLLSRLCELHLLREDEDGDVFVDYEGYNWLAQGADVMALGRMIESEG